MDERTIQILYNLYIGLHNRKRLDETLCIGCHKQRLLWLDEGQVDKTRGYCSLLCQKVVHYLYLGHKRVRESGEDERPDFRQLLLLLDEPVIAQIIANSYPYYREKVKDMRALLNVRAESKQLKELIDQYILKEVRPLSQEVTDTLTDDSLLLFPSLEELYLEDESQITNIGYLTKLQNLVITRDPVGDISLGELQKLTKLILLENSTITHRSLSQLTRLNTLAILVNTTFNDGDLALLPQSLQILLLDECVEIRDTGIMSLSRLTGLTRLELEQITFQDYALKKMTQLKELTVKDNDQFLGNNDSLYGMRSLEILVVVKCGNFEGQGIPYKSSLIDFFAGNTKIDDGTLSSQINITTLDVSNTVVTDNRLKELVNLKRLGARYSPRITGECFSVLTRLEFLDISGSQLVVRKNLSHLTNLTELYLNDTPMRRAKNDIPLKFPFMKILELRHTQAIDRGEMVYFTRLEELSLAENFTIYGKVYLRNLTTLLKLDLSKNLVIENEDIESFTRLESINLKSNTLIKSYALRNMSNLKEIVLRDGTVTDDASFVDYV